MLVEITVKSLKEAAAKLPAAGQLDAVDEGIRLSAKNNDGGMVTVSDVTAKRVEELIGAKPVSAETAPAGTPTPTPTESPTAAVESDAVDEDATEDANEAAA